MKKVRVRFAPSPTGALHIGGVRTVLYNFLFAKKHGGQIILRIEDTDRSRYVVGAEEHIEESLKWLGIHFDEGPEIGGAHAPYRQSERKDTYLHYARQLVHSGYAYFAFDSAEELETMREQLKEQKKNNLQYDSTTRQYMHNSLTLTETEVKKRLQAGEPHVIRLKTPEDEQIVIKDLIRGEVSVHSSQIDDKILIKSDGMPTYHLAHVVDDHAMLISHVIRGEEWLPSTPFHALVYKYLGWENEIPYFAHLPLILRPDGKGKLSKRDAQKLNFPMFPISWHDPNTNETAEGFRERGYLPEAMINFLALLGWNPGDDRELFTLNDLIEVFDLEKVGKAGARLVFQKVMWFNQYYLRAKSELEQVDCLYASLDQKRIQCSREKAAAVVRALKDRVVFPEDFFKMGTFFFVAPTSFDEKAVTKIWSEKTSHVLAAYKDKIKTLISPSESTLLLAWNETIASFDIPKVKAMQALRLAMTGGALGLDLAILLGVLGAEEIIIRLNYILEKLKSYAVN